MSKNEFTLAQLHAIYTVYRDLDSGTRTVNCCTCGKSIYINNFEDCYAVYGHYVDRSIAPNQKYNPFNAYPQCPQCNLNTTDKIKEAFKNYVIYRLGYDPESKIKNDKYYNYSEQYYKQYYLTELKKLSEKFSELTEIFTDLEEKTEEKEKTITDNIIHQWGTYSDTYRQDLDTITKMLNTEPIEYERL